MKKRGWLDGHPLFFVFTLATIKTLPEIYIKNIKE